MNLDQLLNDPLYRLIAGTSIGGIAGLSTGLNKNKGMYNTPEERLKKGIISGVRGAILGAGASTIPTIFGVKF